MFNDELSEALVLGRTSNMQMAETTDRSASFPTKERERHT